MTDLLIALAAAIARKLISEDDARAWLRFALDWLEELSDVEAGWAVVTAQAQAWLDANVGPSAAEVAEWRARDQ